MESRKELLERIKVAEQNIGMANNAIVLTVLMLIGYLAWKLLSGW